MGSKPVRERHHRLYGSTLSSLNRADQWADPTSNYSREELRERQKMHMEQLSAPRLPPSDDKKQKHFLRNKNMANRAEMDLLFGPLIWIYADMEIAKEEVNDEHGILSTGTGGKMVGSPTHASLEKLPVTGLRTYKKAVRIINRIMKQYGIEPSDDLKKKDQVRIADQSRHGLLFDMITTRRVILTGEPHKVGIELYRYVAERYHAVKFTFIGITDNGSKRVARDVFCKDKLQVQAEDAYQNYITKADFEVVDENHMFVVFPEDEKYVEELSKSGVERLRYEEETRRLKHFTPKCPPRAIPPCIARAMEMHRQQALLRKAQEPPPMRCTSCNLPSPSLSQTATSPKSIGKDGAPGLLSAISPSSPGAGMVSGVSASATATSASISDQLLLKFAEKATKTVPASFHSSDARKKGQTRALRSGSPKRLAAIRRSRPTSAQSKRSAGSSSQKSRGGGPSSSSASASASGHRSGGRPASGARTGGSGGGDAGADPSGDSIDAEAFLRSAEKTLQDINATFRRRLRQRVIEDQSRIALMDNRKMPLSGRQHGGGGGDQPPSHEQLHQIERLHHQQRERFTHLAKQLEPLKAAKDRVKAKKHTSEAWNKTY